MGKILQGSLTMDQMDKLNQIDKDKENKKYKNQQTLDKDAFLKLMMTQLQYQNPLNPMDSTQYMSQMAEFSSVEQLSNIASTSLVNNQLMATLASQMSAIYSLLREIAPSDGGTDPSDGTTDDDSKTNTDDNKTNTDDGKTDNVAESNKTIAAEIAKVNAVLEGYINEKSDEKVSDEKIMNAVIGV